MANEEFTRKAKKMYNPYKTVEELSELEIKDLVALKLEFEDSLELLEVRAICAEEQISNIKNEIKKRNGTPMSD